MSLAALFILSGCETTKDTTTVPTTIVEYQKVYLNDFPMNKPITKINDKKDVRQVVALALALSDKQRHAEAAEIFSQAAKDFTSKGKILEQHLISAAVCEYFQAGDIAKTREALATLDSYRTSVYDKFDDNETISNIRKTISTK